MATKTRRKRRDSKIIARVCRQTFTRPIPEDATILTKGGKQFARFRQAGHLIPIPEGATIVTEAGGSLAKFKQAGRWYKAPLTRDGQSCRVGAGQWTEAPLTADGKRCRLETETYYVRYRNADGVWKWAKGYADQEATEALCREIRQREERAHAGLVDPFEQHRKRPLAEHLEEFRQNLDARGVSRQEVIGITSRAGKVIDACKFTRIADLSASAVQAYLGELRQDGSSAQTCNHYLQSIKQFSRWLKRDRRTDDDVLAHLPRFDVKIDRRHDRRALSAEEFTRLVEAAGGGELVEGVPGPDRAMLYVLSAWTGFRRKELSSVTRRSFNFLGRPPTLRVLAAHTKNRRTDEIPLHAVVIDLLVPWLADKGDGPPDEPLFHLRTAGGHWRKTSKMMKRDLEAARDKWIGEAKSRRETVERSKSAFLTYQDDEGLFADFHANRHTFISNLGKAGVDLGMAQKLARHSTPDLTSNVYTHLGLTEKGVAIESLNPLRLPHISAGEQRSLSPVPLSPPAAGFHENRFPALPQPSTGESGPAARTPLSHPCHRSGPTGHENTPQGGRQEGAEEGEPAREPLPQPVNLQRFGTTRHESARVETSGLEPPTPGLQSRFQHPPNTGKTRFSAAACHTLVTETAVWARELARVVEAWPDLREGIRRAIVNLVEVELEGSQ